MCPVQNIPVRWMHRRLRLAAVMSGALLLNACAMHANDLVPDQDKVGVTVTAVGHYGSMIGIPEYSIDGFHAGNNSGWGGGGSTSCCVLLPRTVTKPVFVTVKWQTYRSNVDEERDHEATVPIHFMVQPGKGGAGLFVHFLPGHRVESGIPRWGLPGLATQAPSTPSALRRLMHHCPMRNRRLRPVSV
jgi:hypothetical protein